MKEIIIFTTIAAVAALAYCMYLKSKENNDTETDCADMETAKADKKSMIFPGLLNLISGGVEEVDVMTTKWLVSAVKEEFKDPQVKRVAVIDIVKLHDECANNKSSAQIEQLLNGGIDYVLASMDYNGNVHVVKCIKADDVDDEFIEKLGEEKMIVINR